MSDIEENNVRLADFLRKIVRHADFEGKKCPTCRLSWPPEGGPFDPSSPLFVSHIGEIFIFNK